MSTEPFVGSIAARLAMIGTVPRHTELFDGSPGSFGYDFGYEYGYGYGYGFGRRLGFDAPLRLVESAVGAVFIGRARIIYALTPDVSPVCEEEEGFGNKASQRDAAEHSPQAARWSTDESEGSIVFYITCLILLFNNQQTIAS